MKELLQFKVRGRLSYLYYLAMSTVKEEAMYASALYTQLDSLLAILSSDDKVTAIKLITKICSAYRANKETVQSTAQTCLLYTSPSPRDGLLSRMPSSA